MIAKLFVRPSRRDRRRAGRLGVERLEGRDVPAVTFTVETLSDTTEGGSAGTFRVTATGDPSDFTPYQVVAFWSGTGGTAAYGTDYTASPGLAGYLYFPSSGSQATVTITPTDDSTYEGDETLELRIQRYQMFPTGPVVTGTMTIHDNEPPAVVSVERVADAVEGGTDGKFRFTRTGYLGGSLTVSYTVETTGTGAATPTTDYTALAGTVTFAAYADTADVTVDAGTDGLIEGDEWVSLAIDADTDYEIGWADGAAVFIRDQTREVSVAGVQDAEEGGADGTLRFTRTGDLSETLTVTYTVATTGPSLATPTADYAALTGSVTFAAYSATADVSVVTTDDSVQEPDEVVIVTIAAASAYTIGSGTGQVWIEDDDGGSMYWISDDAGDWWDPANWSANREPVSGDHLYFTSSHNGDMTGFLSRTDLLVYAGLHVLNGHTGTLSLTREIKFGTVEMLSEAAVIDQPNGSGSALTITSRFDWTGGKINASATPSTVTLYGAAAQITTAAATAVTLGSALVLESGAVAQVQAQVNLPHPTGIDVLGASQLVFGPGTAIQSAIQAITERNTIRVNGDSSRLFTDDAVTIGLGLWVNGGTAEVRRNSRAFFEGSVRHANGSLVLGLAGTGISIYMSSGKLIVGDRAHLTAGNRDILVRGGKLATRGSIRNFDNHEATISARGLFVQQSLGATTEIVIGDPSLNAPGVNGNFYGTLTVWGDVYWLGGTYRPLVSPDGGGLSSLWEATVSFRISDEVTMGMTPFLGPTTGPGQQNPPANSQYSIIKCNDGVSRINSPQFEVNNTSWVIVAPLAPDKVLSIKRT